MNRAHYGGEEALTQLSNGLTRWVLGLGLLSLHATTYTIAMVGLVLWNIYDSPNNLWVDEVFYRWTAVLAFHAIAVVCGWTAWRLMRSEQAAVVAAQRSWAPGRATVQPEPRYDAQPPQPWRPPAQLQSGETNRPASPAHRAEDAAKRAFTQSAAWSSTLARRTVGAVSGATTRLTHRGEPAEAHPAQSWPQQPARPTSDHAEFVNRFAPPAPEAAVAQPTPEIDTVVNVTNRPEQDPPPFPMTKEPGQTWVEAATSAWHGPIDPPEHRQNGHRDEATANGAQPE